VVFKTLCCFKKLGNGQSKKKNCQLTLVMLSASLLSTLSIAGLGLAWHGPIQSDPVRHFVREFKMTAHI